MDIKGHIERGIIGWYVVFRVDAAPPRRFWGTSKRQASRRAAKWLHEELIRRKGLTGDWSQS